MREVLDTTSKVKNVLIVGGAGYIGSHTAKLLLKQGYQPIVLDDLSTGHKEAARTATKDGPFYQGSYSDVALVKKIIKIHSIETVMHFGAKALVSESMSDPLLYFEANVAGSIQLFKGLLAAGAKNLIFSSTCATFGQPNANQTISETTTRVPINPYGRTKLQVEEIIKTLKIAHGLNFAILRYFNAAGADPECELGEDHRNETHLLPLALKAAIDDKSQKLSIFGTDYPTTDGSCVRDYVHVNDLSEAHILAMELITKKSASYEFNLGAEKGYSVFEVLKLIRKVTGKDVPHEIGKRRQGDPPILVANSSRAREILGWKPKFGLEAIISTAYEWLRKNPIGYKS